MRKISHEAKVYLKVLHFSDEKLREMEASEVEPNFTLFNKEVHDYTTGKSLEALVDKAMNLLNSSNSYRYKNPRAFIGEDVLGVKLDVDDTFDFLDEDDCIELYDDEESDKETIRNLIIDVFDATQTELGNIMDAKKFFDDIQSELDNMEEDRYEDIDNGIELTSTQFGNVEINSTKVNNIRANSTGVDNTRANIFPIFNRPTNIDNDTCKYTYIPPKGSLLDRDDVFMEFFDKSKKYIEKGNQNCKSIFGFIGDTQALMLSLIRNGQVDEALEMLNELWDKSLFFYAPKNTTTGRVLISRAFTVGNGSPEKKDNIMDATLGDRMVLSKSAADGYGLRHPVYSIVDSAE